MATDNERVEYDILLKAAQAIADLKTLTTNASTFKEQIDAANAAVKRFSKETGVSIGGSTKLLKDMDDRMSKIGKSSVFGTMKNGWQEVGKSAESGLSRAITGINALRIALGAVVSMILFSGIQAIKNFFTEAIAQAREFEDTLYRLTNVERSLSENGIDISMEGLETGINKVKKLLPIFSKEDIAQTMGLLAISTKQLGYTEQQIIDLTTAIGVLNVRSLDNESISTTAQHVLSALLTDNAKGVTSLGIAFGETNLQAKGMELRFLKAGEAASNLSQNEKGVTKLAIIMESANGELDNFGEYLNSNTARMKVLQAAWSDFLLLLGQKMAPVIAKLAEGFTQILEFSLRFISENEQAFNTMVTFFAGLANLVVMLIGGFVKLTFIVGALGAKLYDFLHALPLVGKAVEVLFPQVKFGDTPTNPFAGGGGMDAEAQKYGEGYAEAVTKAEDDITEAMKEARDKRLDIERDYQRKLEDIARNYSQKLADIARNTSQKVEDANRNYGQKVEDINRDANQKIAEAQEDARQKELDAEEEFQRKLAELRQRFLFDLEDALHERDARQVLRLIREYNFDKKNLEDKRKLEREESQLSLQHKLENIEIERQQKLEAAKREHEERLAEIELYAQRERQDAAIANRRALADARLDHQRKLAENREYLKRKLQDIAEAIAKEFQLTAAGAQAISSLLGGYFGAGGIVGQIFNGLQNSLTGMSQVSGSGAVSGDGSYQGYGYSGYGYSGYGAGFAEGGTMIATRPTKMMVGEKEAERITVTPLGRVGRNSHQTFGDKTAAGMGGSISLLVSLSPDVEARIVDTSLENVAVHLEKIARTK